jgi:hypothetical protein
MEEVIRKYFKCWLDKVVGAVTISVISQGANSVRYEINYTAMKSML